MRLAVVEPGNGGGLIHYTYQLCTALANEGVDVTLITGTEYELTDFPHNFRVVRMLRLWQNFEWRPAGVFPGNFIKRFLKKIYFTLRRGIRALRLLWAWVRLTHYLTTLKPDIIQFTRIEFPFETIFVKYLHSRGFVLTQICHEFEARESHNLFSSLLFRWTGDAYGYFSAMFFHAQENRTRFFSLYPSIIPEKNTYIIPHGNSGWLLNIPARSIDSMRKQYKLQGDESVVLFFGLLAPSKGLDDLVDAFAIASHSCDARLIIAGYPTKHFDLNELRTRIQFYGLTDKVIFDTRYLPLNEIKPLMSLATVVVYPYRSSTQSGALQAAYIFGKPVVATAVGGLPEAVEDGRSGFLVPPESPHNLAEKIVVMVNNPALTAQMGNYARQLSETRFSWQTIAKHITLVYANLLQPVSTLNSR